MSTHVLRRVNLILAVVAAIALTGHLGAGKAFAQAASSASVQAKLDAIQAEVNKIEVKADNIQAEVNKIETKTDNLQNTANSTQSTVNSIETKADEIEAKLDRIQVNVLVDQTVCATGAVQCTGTGHTGEAAGPTNHNPVMVAIQVIDNKGMPVNGLTSADIFASNNFGPAGGSRVGRLDCPDCFLGADGLYVIFVHPLPAGMNWKSGAYFLEVQVSAPGPISQLALAKIEIPF